LVHIPPGGGEKLWVLGDFYTFKMTGEESEGAFSVFETVTSAGSLGPPPHIHHGEEESFYVLEGEVEMMTGGDTVKATQGSFVHVPRGVLHTFRNVGTTPARLLVVITPAGFEQFFREVGEPATDISNPPVSSGPPDIERIVTTARKYNCEIPPPPGQ
jgi:mannose-6-phosphate isomerase-like protein (cupin superfamily)